MNRHQRSPKADYELLSAAHAGRLRCTRDHHLNPTYYAAGSTVVDPDRAQIMRFVLWGVLSYEQWGQYGFGVGRLLLTPRGAGELQVLNQRLAVVYQKPGRKAGATP